MIVENIDHYIEHKRYPHAFALAAVTTRVVHSCYSPISAGERITQLILRGMNSLGFKDLEKGMSGVGEDS